ncbi:unnamed protein product [Blepharisma stoltei]|uniref:peptide-methionine (R)-S-oxide reductase n=1 Tax=Blepharisma stoltei TaxID=1481888 RepID=A0AAU9J2B0_9CILI|nr:unnamed protein product [Blepharisma stoltei]
MIILKSLRRFSDLKLKLSPHQLYITQGKGTERPFMGDHWWVKDTGTYYCIVCEQKLFPSHYKFFPDTGRCHFFASEDGATRLSGDNPKDQEVQCSGCGSHLGHFHPEGPAPTHVQYVIESGSLSFKEKPWFTVPPTRRALKQPRREAKALLKKQKEAEREEQRLKAVEENKLIKQKAHEELLKQHEENRKNKEQKKKQDNQGDQKNQNNEEEEANKPKSE